MDQANNRFDSDLDIEVASFNQPIGKSSPIGSKTNAYGSVHSDHNTSTSSFPQDYKTWWANHKTNPITREEAFQAYCRYLEECPDKGCLTINTTQQLRSSSDITSVQSKFALKYRLMSFYEIREIVEDVRPCTDAELSRSKDVASKTGNSKDSKENLDVSGANVGGNLGETWVEVEINDYEKTKTESNQATYRQNETPTTSITTATSGFGSGVVSPGARKLSNQRLMQKAEEETEDECECSLNEIDRDQIWEMHMPPDKIFEACAKTRSLTGDGKQGKCNWCHGTGTKKCKVCRTNTRKWNYCSDCGGQGSVSWQQHYVGADYDSRWDDDIVIKSGRPGRYMNCETCAGVGFGMEGFSCRGCNGKLSVKCTKCAGVGRLVYQRTLNVQYNNHCSWAIVNDTPIPHRFLHQVTGVVIWEDESAEACEMRNLDKLTDGKSALLRCRHQEKLGESGRILQQRQCLSVIPIYEVTYRVSSFWSHVFYVCGLDRSVCVTETVTRCCCCNVM